MRAVLNRIRLAVVVLVTLSPCHLVTLSVNAADPDTGPDEQLLKDAHQATDGPALLDHLRQRTVTDADMDRIKDLIQKLGDDSCPVRQKASADLLKVGPVAVPLLKAALKNTDAEIVRRAGECLQQIQDGKSAALTGAVLRL